MFNSVCIKRKASINSPSMHDNALINIGLRDHRLF